MNRSDAEIRLGVARHERELRTRPLRRGPRPRLRHALVRMGLALPPGRGLGGGVDGDGSGG